MSFTSFEHHNITSVGSTKTGVKSGSDLPNFNPITGNRSVRSSKGCLWEIEKTGSSSMHEWVERSLIEMYDESSHVHFSGPTYQSIRHDYWLQGINALLERLSIIHCV